MGMLLKLIVLRFRRNLPVMFLLATLATAFAGAWWETDQFGISDDERGAFDNGLVEFTGNAKPYAKYFGVGKVTRSKDIVIVGITNKTYTAIDDHPPWRQRYGSLPYDRVLWADVFAYLEKAGAKAIIFDAVMDTPKADPVGDLALGETIKKLRIPVYIGFDTGNSTVPFPKVEAPVNRPPPRPTIEVAKVEGVDDLADAGAGAEEFDFPTEPTPEESAKLLEAATADRRRRAAEAYAFPVKVTGGLPFPTFPQPPGLSDEDAAKLGPQRPVPAIPQVLDVISGFGTVATESDPDGKLRRTWWVYTDGDNTYLTLPLAVAADAFGAKDVELSPGLLRIGDHEVRVNLDGTAEIDYGGEFYERFETSTVVDVLRYSLGTPGGEELFRGKYVFIADFSIGGDIKSTPFHKEIPGVMKQAAILQNLLDGSFILNAPNWASYLFAFLVAFFSVALVQVVRNTFVDIGWPVLLYVGFFLVTGSFLVATKVHLLSALPGLAGTVGSVLASTWERLFARRERQRMKEMFAAYMESDLVDVMVEQRQLPVLDGANLVVTAFFSDIRGFSTFSEKYRDDPRTLMRILNRYLSTVTPLLTREGACIDKYIGDAVVALFGAPVAHHDHALRACRGALEVQKAIAQMREAFRKEGLPEVYTRIGLNTDTMMVGNIGSEQLLDYTAIGDGMNLAARLEAANKEFGTLILIGPGTFAAVKEHVEAREVDQVRVAGKRNAVAVYELLGLKGSLTDARRKVVDLYANSLLMYRARRFGEAVTQLEEALQVDEGDGPSRRLVEKCRALLQHPPGAEWDAVAELSK